jgi:glycosyltransferase EpsF
MIKILHIVPTLGYGGISKVILNYRDRIDQSKFNFSFLTHGSKEDFHEELVNQGAKIFYLKSIGKQGIFKYARNIKEIIKIDNFDIVHIHMSHLNGLFSYILHWNGVKNIITHAHSAKLPIKKHFLFLPILRYLNYKYSSRQIACGDDAGRFCYKKYPFIVINNGIDYNSYRISIIDKPNLRKSIGLADNSVLIGHVGASIEQKNHKFIVEYFKVISKHLLDSYLVLVGDGPLKGKIMDSFDSETLKRVFFLGKRDDVYSIMKQLNIFILPSLFEGLPVVGIEAQAAGLNCLISDKVDKNVDINLGLITFLPIRNSYSEWVKITLQKIENPVSVSEKEIIQALDNNGYNLSTTKKILETIYIETVQTEVIQK